MVLKLLLKHGTHISLGTLNHMTKSNINGIGMYNPLSKRSGKYFNILNHILVVFLVYETIFSRAAHLLYVLELFYCHHNICFL